MKERQMAAVQRECLVWLTQSHTQSKSPSSSHSLFMSSSRESVCMHVSQKTNISVTTESENAESSDADEGEDDAGDENTNQGNNGSDEEKTDSDGEESDQEDTIPQEDKAGGKAHHKEAGSGRSNGNSSKSDAEIKEIKEISPKKNKSSKDESHTMLPELESKATEEDW